LRFGALEEKPGQGIACLGEASFFRRGEVGFPRRLLRRIEGKGVQHAEVARGSWY